MVHLDLPDFSGFSADAAWFSQLRAGSEAGRHLEEVNLRLISCLERFTLGTPVVVQIEAYLPVCLPLWSLNNDAEVLSKAGKHLFD